MWTKRPVNKAFNNPSPLRWRKGPPPSLGWWPASTNRDFSILRWWDGKEWSYGIEGIPQFEHKIAWAVKNKSSFFPIIEWTDRPESWPERSRT